MFTKEKMMKEIEENGVFALEYRLNLNGTPTYVRTKAAIVEEKDGPQMVVGISNIDAQIRREQEYLLRLSTEHKKAYDDALTGVQNKHAYVDLEAKINKDIGEGEPVEFALVVMDVNGLKQVNDTQGHTKGDELIKSAAELIKSVFKNSDVFRVGGDEFAVISQGKDYEKIDELMETIAKSNAKNKEKGVVLACGMARYENDHRVSAVFERADSSMYRNKKFLKGKK